MSTMQSKPVGNATRWFGGPVLLLAGAWVNNLFGSYT
jgi:hypothetical protein